MNIEIGKVIREEISDLLRNYSGSSDRADVSREENLSASTLREITYRNQTVTLRTMPAVKKLLKKAQENAELTAANSKKGAKELKAILDVI